jgi:hypothetical protein
MKSRDQAQTPRLCFKSPQDSIDHARQIVHDGLNWLSINDRDFLKRYEEGEIQIVVKLRVGACVKEYDLVFCAIPDWIEVNGKSGPLHFDSLKQRAIAHGHQDLMLIGDAYLVECPEKVIASFVWLQSSQERVNLLRNISASAFQCVVEGSAISSKGKVSFSRTAPVSGGNAVDSMVKRIPDITGSIADNLGKFFGNGSDEFDFKLNVVGVLRVGFNNSLVWVTVVEGAKLDFEVRDVLLSPSQFAASALKDITHGHQHDALPSARQ